MSNPELSAPVPLTAKHDLSVFDCGAPALNEWLRHRALKNESRFSRTYVVCDGDRVVAYFCICAGAVERAAAPGRVRRNAPDTIPISVIGRLAVSRDHAGRGLGTDILSNALRRIAVASQSIGIGACRPGPRTDAAKQFYMNARSLSNIRLLEPDLVLPIERRRGLQLTPERRWVNQATKTTVVSYTSAPALLRLARL